MMRAGEKIATALVLTSLLCTTHSIHADDEGSFSMIASWVRDYTTLERPGRAVTVGTLEGTITILEGSHSPFVAGEHSFSKCLVYAKQSEGKHNLEAHCTQTDSSNDKFHMGGTRHGGDTETGGGGTGVWKLLGGTGKYAGVSGTCEYSVDYLAENWLVSTAEHCKWHRQ